MPLTTKRQGNKVRVIEKDTGKIAKNSSGSAMDGGGHATQALARKQIQAVTLSDKKIRY